MTLIQALLAIFLPPVSVFLQKGVGVHLILNILLGPRLLLPRLHPCGHVAGRRPRPGTAGLIEPHASHWPRHRILRCCGFFRPVYASPRAGYSFSSNHPTLSANSFRSGRPKGILLNAA